MVTTTGIEPATSGVKAQRDVPAVYYIAKCMRTGATGGFCCGASATSRIPSTYPDGESNPDYKIESLAYWPLYYRDVSYYSSTVSSRVSNP
jgi:hypothetical protein